jgi:hypothetical protein
VDRDGEPDHAAGGRHQSHAAPRRQGARRGRLRPPFVRIIGVSRALRPGDRYLDGHREHDHRATESHGDIADEWQEMLVAGR